MARSIDSARNKMVLIVGCFGGIVADDMGTLRTDIEIENPARPGERRRLTGVLVDTGAELSWVPGEILESLGVSRLKLWRFRQADGTALERWAGSALLYAGGTVTIDEIIFGEKNDLVLLGARSLEGLNLRVDPYLKILIDAGPAPAAVASGDLASAGNRRSRAHRGNQGDDPVRPIGRLAVIRKRSHTGCRAGDGRIVKGRLRIRTECRWVQVQHAP
jgi:predicted aspartyl protease